MTRPEGAPSVAAQPEWTPGAVARMLGISPSTLRTWGFRYGIAPSAHQAGHHRRYTHDDVEILRDMVALIGGGVAPAAAATQAQARGRATTPLAEIHIRPPQYELRAEAVGFASAARRLDGPLLATLCERLVRENGVVDAWNGVFRPVLVRFGDRAATTGRQIEVEHVTSDSIQQALSVARQPPERGQLPAVLACAPEEQHRLPLDALRAALAERGCPSRMLGARVPGAALLDAVRRLRPRTVTLWAHDAAYASMAPIADLVAGHSTTVLVAGPGWQTTTPGTHSVSSLIDAVETILSATGRP